MVTKNWELWIIDGHLLRDTWAMSSGCSDGFRYLYLKHSCCNMKAKFWKTVATIIKTKTQSPTWGSIPLMPVKFFNKKWAQQSLEGSWVLDSQCNKHKRHYLSLGIMSASLNNLPFHLRVGLAQMVKPYQCRKMMVLTSLLKCISELRLWIWVGAVG